MARPKKRGPVSPEQSKSVGKDAFEWADPPRDVSVVREARVEFRSTTDQKNLIEHAAMLRGMSVTDYVRSTVLERAADDIHRMHVTMLSMRDWERFMQIIENPQPPNERLRRAFKAFREADIQSLDD